MEENTYSIFDVNGKLIHSIKAHGLMINASRTYTQLFNYERMTDSNGESYVSNHKTIALIPNTFAIIKTDAILAK